MLLLLLFLTFSVRIGCQPEKTTLHGGQFRFSWSAKQGKKEEKKKLWQRPPPSLCSLFGENTMKTSRRIYMPRRSAGLGPSRVRTRIPLTRRLGQ